MNATLERTSGRTSCSGPVSGWLDRLPPRVRVFGRSVPSTHVTALTGYLTAVALVFAMTVRLGLLLPVSVVLVAAGSVSIVVLALGTKVLVGEERLTYYHHEIAVLASTAIVSRMLDGRVLPYLDVMAVAVGGFFVFGRIGCLLVGCCQGRPGAWGTRYGEEHAVEGFPSYFVGVRLVPVQLIESFWVLVTVLGGVTLLLHGAPAGSTLAWYTVVYGVGRFALEFLRGDSSRPYFGTFSEAQWTSLLLMSQVAIGELAGWLPFSAWHVAATGALAALMAATAVLDRGDRRLLRPRHLREIAELVEAARTRTDQTGIIHIGETSLGLRLSASAVTEGGRDVELVAFSHRDTVISPGLAARLGRFIAQLRRCSPQGEPVRGEHDIYQLLLPGPNHAL